jgi:hypothetical protein
MAEIDPSSPVPPASRKQKAAAGMTPITSLLSHTARVRMALKFGRCYEFTLQKGVPIMLGGDPLVNHSWLLPGDLEYDGPRVRSFSLSPGGAREIILPIGVTAVLGRSRSGKTRFALEHLFLTNERSRPGSCRYYKFAEPGDDAALSGLSDSISCHTFEVEMVDKLARDLVDPSVDLIIIDSLRYLFYGSAGGATGKGGVNMSLFIDLTYLDTVASLLGKTVLVVINPMTDDETAFNFYREAAVGAVAGVVVMMSYRELQLTSRYQPTRDFIPLNLAAKTSLDAGDQSAVLSQRVAVSGGRATNNLNPAFDRK